MKDKNMCMEINCKEKVDLTVAVKVKGGRSVVTRVCLKHIRKPLSRDGADYVLWNCMPVKKVSK